MKISVFLPLALLAFGPSLWADDQLRNAQTELKSQGFYYGDVTGQSTSETTAAIRRFQIRNGLEVTGTLNKETLASLGLEQHAKATAPTAQAPVRQPAPAPVVVEKKAPPVNLRRTETTEESDRNFLRREEARDQTSAPAPVAPPPPENRPEPRDSSVVPPPAPLDAPSADFPVLFAETPFANAPAEVQQETLRQAQTILADRGFYRDIVDGLPGPATEEALLTYQRSVRLTLTGRLDLETLGRLRLLPGRSSYSDESRYHAPTHVYRGVWLDR